MKWQEIIEAVGRITKQNQTVDVGPNEIKTQAAKFGNTVDKDGRPPTLSKKVKGSSTNVLYNLGLAENGIYEGLEEKWSAKYKRSINCSNPKGFSQKAHCAGRKKKESIEEGPLKSKSYKKSLKVAKLSGRRRKKKLSTKFSEGYKLQLERDPNMYVLHITDTATGKRTEVRGKSGYESGNHDANDKLHQLLDKVGKSANISELINGEVVTINPKHPDAERAKKATDVAYNENINPAFADVDNETLKNLAMLKSALSPLSSEEWFKVIDQELEKAGYLWNGKKFVKENFADGKKKGKSRPGRVKRAGASCNGSVTQLRKRAKNASGEKAKMYHWCANMKSGRKK